MIVVDANIIAYLLIEGERTRLAAEVWRLDPEWYAPTLWRHEFLNILATYVKAGGATLAEAGALWEEATRLMAPGERETDMGRALELAVERKVSAYDAQYVALAFEFGVPLITEDRPLRTAFPGQLLSLREVCEQLHLG